jgi:hypothetical protein
MLPAIDLLRYALSLSHRVRLELYPIISFNRIIFMRNTLMGAIALFIIVSIIAAASCKKGDSNPTCNAGAGGNVEIVVFALHNGDTLINYTQHTDSALVKFNATSSPGTSPSAYDKIYVGEPSEDHIHLTNLSCGTYFIYRTAYDSVSGNRYTGTAVVSFTKTSGEVDTAITVN